MKDDGIFFLNIGDSYSSHKDGKQVAQSMSIGKPSEQACILEKGDSPSRNGRQLKEDGMMNKCKMLIPHRIAITLLNEGWILRNDIVWAKGNSMPESCKDRFSKKFEYIFMFTKNEQYYFDLDAVRETHKPQSYKRVNQNNGHPVNNSPKMRSGHDKVKQTLNALQFLHPKGKNPGDVWAINTQPSSERHFAMWPEALCERMIKCSTKPGDAVLDPFAGSGTTLRVAERLNRIAYGMDLGYQDIQRRRLTEIQKELI